MDQQLLRAYLSTVYEFPTGSGPLRASMDGDVPNDPATLPDLLTRPFAVLTAYNPRSMLLPRKVNEGRHIVMRDLLILGCYRVEACVGYEEEPEGTWREPSWLVHNMDREEVLAAGRVFRQNTVVMCRNARPELIITDPTFDDVGKVVVGHWRVRA
ncbi:MAG: DUF3293 domain-containing protein [Myxococcales bacterium]|jgi:hypothetical protein